MKLAISSEGDTLQSNIDPRFGSCKQFLIVEIVDNAVKEVIATVNEGLNQNHGAGIRAAQQLSGLGVNVVISGNLGPNVSKVLAEAGIKTVYSSDNAKTAIEKFLKNELKEINKLAGESSDSEGSSMDSGEIILFPLLEKEGLNSRISEHFGHANFFGAYNFKTQFFEITENHLNHSDSKKTPIDQIIETINPKIIFAKGIGQKAMNVIKDKRLILKTGDYETVNDVLANLEQLSEVTDDCGHHN